jgi:hypothetical protein
MSIATLRLGLPLVRVSASLLALLCATTTGCSQVDPCEGQSEACITVQVESPGGELDLIRTVYSLDGGTKQQRGFAVSTGEAKSFPVVFALNLGSGGSIQADIIGELSASPTFHGTFSESVSSGEHKRIVVTLDRNVSKLPFVGPEPRYGAGLVAVPLSSPTSLVLFGGVVSGEQTLGDTWEYSLSQNTWQRITSPMSPGPRQPNMVADPLSDRVLVVQGMGAGGVVQLDTWQYQAAMPGDARTWQPITTVTAPTPPRAFAGLTIVPSATMTPTTLLFGGITGSGGSPLSDLWRMQSPGMTNLALVNTTGAPQVKSPKLLSTQTDVYLVGSDEMTKSTVQVYRLDAVAMPPKWTVVSQEGGAPSYRSAFSATIDPQGQQIVLFGGIDGAGNLLSDTFRYSIQGTTWATVSTTQVPPARIDASLTFAQGVFMMFGGRDSSLKQKIDNWKLTSDGWKRWL